METKTNYSIPIAIILAGLIIGGALYFNDGRTKEEKSPTVTGNQPAVGLDQIRPISETDHLRGNPNAEIIIVEYSDTECPFCSRFHNTMKQVMTNYGKTGQVAWVYRHFPLDQLHSKSRQEATALECANELGGNDKFWAYTDRIYQITPANDGLDLAELPKIAEFIGLDVSKFNECLAGDKYADKIQADLDNAQATGGRGTPWGVILTKSGEKIPLNGAQPYDAVKQTIDNLLTK